MINYKDLMIGNWVYESERSEFPMKVVSVGEYYCYLDFPNNEGDAFNGYEKDMMPIEVTEELLEKIEFYNPQHLITSLYLPWFELNLKGYSIKIDDASNSNDRKWSCQIDNNRYESIGGLDFQYLHELQNGIRLITKSDLEIKML